MSSCIHRGKHNDPETPLAYPSARACCFRITPALSLTLEHQETFCLSQNYVECPLLQMQSAETSHIIPQPSQSNRLQRIWRHVLQSCGLGAKGVEKHSAEFKLIVAFEAASHNQQAYQTLARKYNLSVGQIKRWQEELLPYTGASANDKALTTDIIQEVLT